MKVMFIVELITLAAFAVMYGVSAARKRAYEERIAKLSDDVDKLNMALSLTQQNLVAANAHIKSLESQLAAKGELEKEIKSEKEKLNSGNAAQIADNALNILNGGHV